MNGSIDNGSIEEVIHVDRWVQMIMRKAGPLLCAGILAIYSGNAVADDPTPVEAALQAPVQTPAVTAYQIQHYLMKRIPKAKLPSTAAEWREEQRTLRTHILNDIIYHGWPREWVEAPTRFEQVGVIDTGFGYRLRKFRYEIVPGFFSTAILYEPEKLDAPAPGILNVIGHEHMGHAAEYEQKRCINFAKRGMYALSLSWMGFGELAQPENDHDETARLDLAGTSAVGLFYLSMRRGLDYLASLKTVDAKRLGVTGLSGGGWQTTLLSALDERVAVSVEVAGFGSQESNLIRPGDTNEVEESATDLTANEDYPFLVAMRAPRPTLLVHNGEDDCCFRAELVKPYIYEQIKPFFKLMGDESALAWHENRDPGTHNYQLDNREQAYAFFTRNFGLPLTPNEIPSDGEIRAPEELAAGLPAGELTIAGQARKLAGDIVRAEAPSAASERAAWVKSQKEQLASVLHFKKVSVDHAWRMANTKHLGLQTLAYRFDFSNELSASAIWLAATSTSPYAPATIVLNDGGYKASGKTVTERVDRGEQVLALDTVLNGAMMPQEDDPAAWAMMLTADGDRPLGIEVGQLLAAAEWLRSTTGQRHLRMETQGIRSQMVALVAAAIEPDMFNVVVSIDAMDSLSFLMEGPLLFRTAPELFCQDLYKYFDVDRLEAIAAPTKIERRRKITGVSAK